jgi:putative aldouronate transport system permease protein
MKRLGFSKAICYVCVSAFSLFCLMPMALVLIASFTDEESIIAAGYSFFPKKLSLEAYSSLFKSNNLIGNSYMITIFVTIVGTACAVLISCMAAYTIVDKNVKYRNGIAFFFLFTMLFSGGIVPWYIITCKLGLYNNLFSLIIPSLLFSPFNLILTYNYMRGLPAELKESAKLDGASDWIIAFRIYFPLSLPVISTIALFYGMAYWNDWWNSIMLVNDRKLYPLQYLLFVLQSNISMLKDMAGNYTISKVPINSLKNATVVVTIGPIIFAFPFLQRYFVKGLIIGAVKG